MMSEPPQIDSQTWWPARPLPLCLTLALSPGRHGVEEDEAEAEKPLDETEPPPAPKDSKVEQLCGWMAAACGLDSKVVAKYAEALVGEGVDQPSDLADLDDGDWPSSIKTLHLKKIKAAVAKGDFDVPATFDLLLAVAAVARRPARPPWTHVEDAILQDAVAQVSRPLHRLHTAYTIPAAHGAGWS